MKNSKAVWLAAALVALGLSQTPAASAQTTGSIEEYVRDYAATTMTSSRVPGMVFIQVDATGVTTALALGSADIASSRAMTLDTPLRVGSISKPITSAIVLEMYASGALDLDTPVDTYLGFDMSDGHGPSSTLRQLLEHRGGYPDAFVASHHRRRGYEADLGRWAQRAPGRSHAPDVVSSYSSVGYSLAGAAAAAAADVDFARLADVMLFEPLGMRSATFAQPPPQDVATGYGWNGDDFDAYPIDSADLIPGAGMTASAKDIAKFMTALLDEDGPLAETTRTGILRRSGPEQGLRGYTLGLTEWQYERRSVLYHEGNGIGTVSRLMVLPDEGVAFFTAVNGEALIGLGDPSAQTRFIRDLHDGIISHFHPGPYQLGSSPTRPGAGTPTSDVAGTYVPSRVDPNSVLRLEALVSPVQAVETLSGIRFGGQPYGLVEAGTFRNGASWIRFAEGPDGKVYATRGGTTSFRMASWWETTVANLAMIGISLTLLIVGSVLSLSRISRIAKGLVMATVVSAIAFLGLLAYGLATVQIMELFTGLTRPIQLAQLSAAIMLMASVASAIIGPRTHQTDTPSVRARVGVTLVSMAGLALSGWAWVWGVLPL